MNENLNIFNRFDLYVYIMCINLIISIYLDVVLFYSTIIIQLYYENPIKYIRVLRNKDRERETERERERERERKRKRN